MGCVRGVGQESLGDNDWPCDDHGMEKPYTLFAITLCNITIPEHSRLDKLSLANHRPVPFHELNCLGVRSDGRSRMTARSAFVYSLPANVKYKKELERQQPNIKGDTSYVVFCPYKAPPNLQ